MLLYCTQKVRTNGSLCEYMVHFAGAASIRCPLRPERAALALWVRPVHASSMVESTADGHLTVDGDAMFVVGADPEHAAPAGP